MKNLKDINKRIVDRTDCFYWQCDRKISDEEAEQIFADKHQGIENEKLIKAANAYLKDKVVRIEEPLKQGTINSVNSMRVGVLQSGREVLFRCHPKGIAQGYFHVESLAAQKTKDAGFPSYSTLAIHDANKDCDVSFQIIEKLDGENVQKYLLEQQGDANKYSYKSGKLMAQFHKANIKVEGFGKFDNIVARNQGKLVGLSNTFADSMRAGLQYELKYLLDSGIITKAQAKQIFDVFNEDNPLLKLEKPVLVHNDFIDWNLMTDGSEITGIIDWDECIASHPTCDIASYSTFVSKERFNNFLNGYFSETPKTETFDKEFILFELRYWVMKVVIRLRKYLVEKNTERKNKLESGTKYFKELLEKNEIGAGK